MEVTKRTIGEMSNDTRILYNMLELNLVKEGKEFVSYDDLTAAIGGRDVRAEARGMLITARKNVQLDHHVLLEAVSGQGIKRSTEYAGVLSNATRHIVKKSRKESKRVINAMVDKTIPSADLIQINTGLSILGVMVLFGTKKSAKQIEAKVVENAAKELPTADTLRLFTK